MFMEFTTRTTSPSLNFCSTVFRIEFFVKSFIISSTNHTFIAILLILWILQKKILCSIIQHFDKWENSSKKLQNLNRQGQFMFLIRESDKMMNWK